MDVSLYEGRLKSSWTGGTVRGCFVEGGGDCYAKL